MLGLGGSQHWWAIRQRGVIGGSRSRMARLLQLWRVRLPPLQWDLRQTPSVLYRAWQLRRQVNPLGSFLFTLTCLRSYGSEAWIRIWIRSNTSVYRELVCSGINALCADCTSGLELEPYRATVDLAFTCFVTEGWAKRHSFLTHTRPAFLETAGCFNSCLVEDYIFFITYVVFDHVVGLYSCHLGQVCLVNWNGWIPGKKKNTPKL